MCAKEFLYNQQIKYLWDVVMMIKRKNENKKKFLCHHMNL